jgi:histidinol-phosphate aminotransferase
VVNLAVPIRPALNGLKPYIPGLPAAHVARAYGLQEVVKLASNESPLGPSPKALQAARAACFSAHLYPDPLAADLRETLAGRLGVSPAAILVGNGSDEILRLLASAYLQPGETAVVPACSFPNYRTAATVAGARVVEVPLHRWAMDLPALEGAVRAGGPARICYLCRPNNPTGGVFPEEAFRRFLAAVPAETLVVLDEAYREFDETPFDSVGLLRSFPNLVLTRTFSKAYGLAGLRVGYGIGDPALWQPLLQVREPFSVNLAAQAAALAALTDEEYLTLTRATAREGKETLYHICNEIGLSYVRSEGNFVLIDLGRPAGPVCETLLGQGVIVRPCGGFGLHQHIRVTAGTRPELERLAGALRAALGA